MFAKWHAAHRVTGCALATLATARTTTTTALRVIQPPSAHLVECPRAGQARNAVDVRARMDRHFQHAVALLAEDVERLLHVLQIELMRDERRQIDATLGDERHQP